MRKGDKILVNNQTPIKRSKFSRFFRNIKYFLKHPIWYINGQGYREWENGMGFSLWKYPPDDTPNGIYEVTEVGEALTDKK